MIIEKACLVAVVVFWLDFNEIIWSDWLLTDPLYFNKMEKRKKDNFMEHVIDLELISKGLKSQIKILTFGLQCPHS